MEDAERRPRMGGAGRQRGFKEFPKRAVIEGTVSVCWRAGESFEANPQVAL